MHWLDWFLGLFNWIVIAFLYALVGCLIGGAYALLTGADMASFGSVVTFAGFFGPVVIFVIAAFRKLARRTYEAPIARAIYHTLLITFAAPVLLYGAQLIAVAAGASKVARAFEVLKYWSIPLVFITAVLYGIWRVVEGNRPRTTSTSGRSGGIPPFGSGTPGDRPVIAQRAEANGPSSGTSARAAFLRRFEGITCLVVGCCNNATDE